MSRTGTMEAMSLQQPRQHESDGPSSPVTLRTLRRMAAAGEPFACLAVYDATTARLMDEAGVHLLLAGDSAAEVILGLPRTIHMPLDFAIQITAAVRRGARRAHVMADMPFMSYQASPDDAMTNAARFMTEGLADSIKIEADASLAPLVDRMTRAGVPVCAHIGSRPQTAAITSGYASAGRTASQAEQIVQDAVALEQAGAAMLLIEAVPDEVTRRVMEHCGVPVIGIGAGTACHGQILVVHDLLGLTPHPPRFAEPAAQLADPVREAGRAWVRRVASRELGGERYTMKPGEQQRMNRDAPRAVLPTSTPGETPGGIQKAQRVETKG